VVKIKKFYITTAIDYVNAPPHLGHLYEKICADVIARFHRLKGEDTFFLTGTDENAQKNEKAAKELGIPVKELVDKNSQIFKQLCKTFNISNDDFIRTTEDRHVKVSQLIFKKLFDNGDIYKGYYEGYYCSGCEAFLTEKNLVDGKCPEHGKEPEWLREESYFFKLSKYHDQILKLVSGNFIIPEERKNEIATRIKNEGLKDLSVSRPNVSWGIKTPVDDKHTIYVWIDALVNYISGMDYPNGKNYKKYWPADVHLIGKGINWFHSVIWPAILLSAGIPLPKTILVHGYITLGGEKMSKSKGTVIDPFELEKKYYVNAIRYFLLREVPFGKDGSFSEKDLIEKTNNELVAIIGNFIHRTLSFVSAQFDGKVPEPGKYDKVDKEFEGKIKSLAGEVGAEMEKYELDRGIKKILEFCGSCNQYFQKKEPWKNKVEAKNCLYLCVNAVRSLAILLDPFVPSASEKLWELLNCDDSVHEQKWNSASKLEIKAGHKIKKPEVLFKVIETKK